MTAARKIELKQHFTEAKDLNALMCKLLGSVDGLSLLEPSVGHGAFLSNLDGYPNVVHVADVDQDAIDKTIERHINLNIVPHKDDFIDIFLNDIFSDSHALLNTMFDAVISNPPYGLYLEREYRARLKKAFPTLYVRESYGLFFVFAVSRLKNDGRYVFLLPDTFLTSINHKPLRQFISSQAAPTAVVRFPSKRFETVNFGYGNLCIIAGHHRPLKETDRIAWLDAFELDASLHYDALKHAVVLTGSELQATISTGWSAARLSRSGHVPQGWPILSDMAECRTGIYTGDNGRFIGYDPHRVARRLNGHPIEWKTSVTETELTPAEVAKGLDGSAHYVPLVRGGHREPFERPSSAIDWSPRAIHHYKTDPKARFQNSVFYFQEGLSVPMVSTKRISAALMKGAVFDQGVVGVFPKQPDHLAALLLYLNSRKASEQIKGIVNGSANNSANYMKRLPVPPLDSQSCGKAQEILAAARKAKSLSSKLCDDFVDEIISGITK
jgi:adenine-specific DNA-methyltransferase